MQEAGTKLIFAGCLAAVAFLTVFRPEASKPPNADAATISFSFWGSYEEWNMWRKIADAFMADNPDVWVKLNYIPGNYDDKIRLLLAADSAPDVMMIQDEPFPGYARYGKFADLTDYACGPDALLDWRKDVWSTAPELFKYRGRTYGIPCTGGNLLVFYNRKMFRDLGVEYPKDDWTFDDLVATAQALTRDLDGDGRRDTFGIQLPHWIYFMQWTWGYGADYLNADRTDWAFTGPQAVAATRFYQDLRWKYHVAPSMQEIPPEQEATMFMTGRIGMMVGGPWTGLGFTTAGIDFDVVHMPIGPDGKRHTRVSWDGLAMAASSKHKDEAWRFMAFVVSPKGQAIVGRSLRSIPPLLSAKESFMLPDNGWHEEKFVEALEYASLQPITYHWNEMRVVLDKEYEQLLLNKATPEETVDRIARSMREQKVFPIEDER